MIQDRRGGAIPLVLVLLLALTGVAYGVLSLALAELRAASATRHALSASVGAKGGLVRGFQALDTLLPVVAPFEDGPLMGGVTPEGIRFGSGFRWLGPEFFLLEGKGGSSGWPGQRTLGWVGWALNPVSRVAAFQGGLEVRGSFFMGPGAEASFSVSDPGPLGWPADVCLAYEAVLDSLFPGPFLPLWNPLPAAGPDGGPDSSIPSLGLLSGQELLTRGAETGGSPHDPDFSNRAGCPGSQESVLWAEGESISMDEGKLCGIIVSGGDLTIGVGARFQGLALAAGDFVVEQGGRFDGMARAGGSATLADGGTLLVSPCAVLWVLENTPVLRRPVLLPGGHRINGF